MTSGRRDADRTAAAAPGAGARCPFTVSNSGQGQGVREAPKQSGLCRQSGDSGWGPWEGQGWGRETEAREGGAEGSPKASGFMEMRTGAGTGRVCPPQKHTPPSGQRGVRGLPHTPTLLFLRKKTVTVRVGFLVTALSSLLPRAHSCVWRCDSLSPTRSKDIGKASSGQTRGGGSNDPAWRSQAGDTALCV